MRRMVCAASALLLAGCVSARIGTHTESIDDSAVMSVAGIVNGHVSLDALPTYDGSVFELGILSDTYGPGEVASIELWPLAGVGIGVVGLRLRVLFLEAALGGLFYHPEPLRLPEEDAGPAPGDYGSRESVPAPPPPQAGAAKPEASESPAPRADGQSRDED